jgi:hypothetical protein
MVRAPTNGRLEWHRHDTGAAWKIIGGPLVAQPAVTNSFEDRIGAFSLFAELTDGNLWQKVYNRYFVGRLANLAPNDYDRDARTDKVIVRDGVWWILPSSGLPAAPFTFGQPGDVFLPAADYSGDFVSDVARFERATGTWYERNIDRQQAATSLPISVGVSPNSPEVPLQYGAASDKPVPGDYDGDWIMDRAVFRVTNNTWYAALSGGGELVVGFGVASDRQVPADYDGDGKTDVAVFRPSDGTWYVHPSSGGPDIVRVHCVSTDRLVPGDYDGDGRADFGCFRPSTGQWLIKLSTGEADINVYYGAATDRVVPGDYDGDGRTDIALFRPSTGTWHVLSSSGGPETATPWGQATDVLPWPEYTQTSRTAMNDIDRDLKTDLVVVRNNSWIVHKSFGGADISTTLGLSQDLPLPTGNLGGNGVQELLSFRASDGTWRNRSLDRDGTAGTETSLQYGESTDVPVPGDYDGDGLIDETIWRPSTGTWWSALAAGGELSVQFGESTDKPVPADYDGDGRTDQAVWRLSNLTWYVHPSAGGADIVQAWGGANDRFVPADYDGDRRADFAVFQQSGLWHIRLSATGGTMDQYYGEPTDRIAPGDYDGDGRTDIALFRPWNSTWYALPSTGGEIVTAFGISSDRIPWPVHAGN